MREPREPRKMSAARACRRGQSRSPSLNGPMGSVHLCQGEIFLAFDKLTKHVKANSLLLTILGGTVKAQNRNIEPHVPYNIDEKSLVLEGKTLDKLSKLLSGVGVWGKEVRNGKVFPILAKDGQPTELCWCPPEAGIATCTAFMQCKWVQPIFAMSQKDTNTLSPIGVCFVMAKPLPLDPPRYMVKLE